MTELLKRAEELARERQRRAIGGIVQRLRALLGEAKLEASDTSVQVSGRGVLKRWLTDPNLRFLWGGMK